MQILTADAVEFVSALVRRFAARHRQLLEAREQVPQILFAIHFARRIALQCLQLRRADA